VKLPDWTREPLVHFLVAGALVFALFALRGEEVDPSSRSIDVSKEQQAQLALQFERTMSRPPTDAELDAQIAQFVRDEILYREALRLGLDRNDAVVRRRMVQKMDMLASAQAETAPVGEATLRQWYRAHRERFARDARYDLTQLWFADRNRALAARRQLVSGQDWQQLGERISLPSRLEGASRVKLMSEFGELFVRELDRIAPSGQWQGPIASGLGWHLVRFDALERGAVPPFEEVREEVETDWRSSTMAKRKDEAFELLRSAYRVEVER